jgi:hypothetical protein
MFQVVGKIRCREHLYDAAEELSTVHTDTVHSLVCVLALVNFLWY